MRRPITALVAVLVLSLTTPTFAQEATDPSHAPDPGTQEEQNARKPIVLPEGCGKLYTYREGLRRAKRTYARSHVSRKAARRVGHLRRCQHSDHTRVKLKRKVRKYREAYKKRKAAREAATRNPIPGYIVACESGGDYGAVNPTSGARGKYQIMPFHYQRGGVCSGLDWSPRGQDECAARIWETSGPGAWDCA
jgi:hypothetical protein